MKNKIKLQTRLFLSVGLVVGVALFSTAWFVSLVQEKNLEAEELKRIYLRSESMTRRMGHLMYSANWRYMMIVLNGDLKNDISMLYFFITDPNGKILLCDDRNRIGTFEPKRVPLVGSDAQPVFKQAFYTESGTDSIQLKVYRTTLNQDVNVDGKLRAKGGDLIFDTFWNIRYMGKDFGTLRMGFSRAELLNEVSVLRMSILGVGGVVLVFLLAMIVLVVKQSMAPLEAFTRHLIHIQDDPGEDGFRRGLTRISFDKIPASTLEMENLILAFESLRQMVVSTWQDLDEYQTNLETMVLERTTALKTANLELEKRILERQEIEERLVNAQKLEAVGILAGGVAHDFNNLLMGILGNASLIQQKTDPRDDTNAKAAKIVGLVKTGSEVVQQLLGFARKGKYAPELLDLNELLKSSLQMFSRTRKDLEIKCRYQQGLWKVKADFSQMGQVMLNLFFNASEAMPEKGLLLVETQNVLLDDKTVKPHGVNPGGFVKMSVVDNGEGMDEAVRTRVFDPFFTTKKMGRGTGLGLASVYGIVKNHGGFVTVESTPGKGAVFSVVLPVFTPESVSGKESTV